MWEYKSDYVAIIPREGRDDNTHLSAEERANHPGCLYEWQFQLLKQLDKWGADGWEVVSIPEKLVNGDAIDGFVLLKRLKRGGS